MFYIIKPTHQKKVYVARALINRSTKLSIMCECHSETHAEAIVEALSLQEALSECNSVTHAEELVEALNLHKALIAERNTFGKPAKAPKVKTAKDKKAA